MKNHFRAFLFDLDGTLQDTEKLYVKAVQTALAERNCLLSDGEALQLVYGRGWMDVYRDSNARFPHAYPDVQSMEEAVRRLFVTLRDAEDVTIAGSIELLKRLSYEYPVAIVSGSHRRDIQEGIERMGIGENLRFFLGVEDCDPGKPSPVGYLLAAEKLNIAPCHCLVFEDSTAGVLAAKAAGMTCVGLRRPGAPSQNLSLADWIVSDLTEFDLSGIVE